MEQEQIERFYAVTTHNEVFWVRGVSIQNAEATKVAQNGIHGIGGFSLKGSGKLLIASCLSMGGDADGKSAPIAALFLDQWDAMACSRAIELLPSDSRWEKETLAVTTGIGSDHPVFVVGHDPGNRLRFFDQKESLAEQIPPNAD